MKTHLLIHRLALLSLFLVAAMGIIGSIQQVPGAPAEMVFAPVFGIAIWSLLLWRIWKRPRQWGLGVGIFLFLMIAFQSFLWWRSLDNPRLDHLDRSVTRFIVLYELPIFIAGVCCTLLRFFFPTETSGSNVPKAD